LGVLFKGFIEPPLILPSLSWPTEKLELIAFYKQTKGAPAFEYHCIGNAVFMDRFLCVIDKIMHAIIESWPCAVFIGSTTADLFIHWPTQYALSVYCYMKIGPFLGWRSAASFVFFRQNKKEPSGNTSRERAIVSALPLKDIIMCSDKI